MSGWPTPQVMDKRDDTREAHERSDRANKGGCSNLRESVQLTAGWPTPNTMDSLPPMDYEKRLNHPSRPGRSVSGNLREVATLVGGQGAPDSQNTAEARIMRLKGYGNAIVPQVAQVFIEAYLESKEEVDAWIK